MRPIAKWFLGGTVVFALVAVLWGPVAVPALVKFPTNLDVHARYEGTMNVYVDQATGLPLAQPLHIPMTIQRDMTGVGKLSSASKAVVDETVTVKAGPLTQVERSRYVLDRRSNKNVSDTRGYALDPANPVDRAGMFSFQYPRGVKVADAQFAIFNNHTGVTYELRQSPTGPATAKVDGLKVVRMTGTAPVTPVSAYFAHALQAQGLPTQLTAAQVKAALKAKGIDLDQAMTALAGTMQPADLQQLQQIFAAPVKLQYVWSNTGDIAVEPKTGALVDATSAVEAVGVVSDPSSLTAAGAILAKYDAIPAVHSALASMKQLATAPPQPVYDMRFSQTAATTADLVSDVKANITKMNLVQTYARLVFAGLAIAFLIVTLLTFRPKAPHEPAQAAELPVTEEVPKAA